MIYKKAFTLAEVLITLGIIGIVAALTLPVLINSYKNKQTVTQLKKVYSILSQATILAQANYGEISDWNIKDNDDASTENIVYYYKPYLKLLKDCRKAAGCWSNDKVTGLDGVSTSRFDEFRNSGGLSYKYSIALADGTFIVFDIYSNLDVLGISDKLPDGVNATMVFIVDINGLKRPNRVGRDIFVFALTNNGVVPAGISNNSENCSKNISGFNSGIDCAAKVLEEGDINY